MGTLEITCHNCGGRYELIPGVIMAAGKLQEGVIPYMCPHCTAKMNPRTWDKLVSAFWELEEVNRELRTEYTGYGKRHPLMQAEYHTYFNERMNLHEDF